MLLLMIIMIIIIIKIKKNNNNNKIGQAAVLRWKMAKQQFFAGKWPLKLSHVAASVMVSVLSAFDVCVPGVRGLALRVYQAGQMFVKIS